MTKLVILHFSPLELYPPVQNLLNVLGKKNAEKRITVLTTNVSVSTLKNIEYCSPGIKIKRLGVSGIQIGTFKRYLTYFYFNIGALVTLIFKRPESLLYFETISSFPAYLYKKYFNSKVNVFIHYHEYTSPDEYEKGMIQTRYFHKYEKWIYQRSNWLSHTNEYRLKQFVDDIKPVIINNPRVLPNYPPENWPCKQIDHIGTPVKAVYIGALSLKTMYVKQFVEYVIEQKGNLLFDIYAYNIDGETKRYLQGQNNDWIKLKAGVNYLDLPDILKQYEVGVVLYKGHISNYIYNAPNKLFEYYASGLDIWFPQIMKGSLPYVTHNTYPKIMALDFDRLNDKQLNNLSQRNGYEHKQPLFTCENVLEPLISKLMKDD